MPHFVILNVTVLAKSYISGMQIQNYGLRGFVNFVHDRISLRSDPCILAFKP